MRIKPMLLLCLWVFLAIPTPAQQGPYHNDMIDSYGNLPFKLEKGRLDDFAMALREKPDWVAYINIYAGRKSCVGEAQARALQVKRYLVRRWRVQEDRIVWRDGGYREELTVDLWVRPRGAPVPIISPTIDPKEAQVRGRCRV